MPRRSIPIAIGVAVVTAIGAIIVAIIQARAAGPHPDPTSPSRDSATITASQSTFPAPLEGLFAPSGWTGDGRHGVRYFSLSHVPDTIDGKPLVAIRLLYQPGPDGWAGVTWQYPDGNWGDTPGRRLVGAREVAFLARGEKGGEIVEFKSGGIQGKHPDSFDRSLGKVVVTKAWQSYRIDLAGTSLESVVGAFGYVVAASDNGGSPVAVRVADITIR